MTALEDQFYGWGADGFPRRRNLSDIFPSGAAALSQVTGEGRFSDADGTGIWILGHGVKYPSAGAAASPGQVFPISAAFLAANPKMKLELGAVFAVNDVAVPDTASIDVGFYPVAASGAAGTLKYTLNTSGQIVENYGDGIAADTIYGRDNPDRRAAFVSGGDRNYALGVNIGVALPTGCVVDVSAALLVTPF